MNFGRRAALLCAQYAGRLWSHLDTRAYECYAHLHASALAQTSLFKLQRESPGLSKGIQVHAGHVICRPVAEAQHLRYSPLESAISH